MLHKKHFLISVSLLVTLISSISFAANEFRWNFSGGNCHVTNDSDKSCIWYDTYARIVNSCTNDDVAVNCEIGQVTTTAGDTLDKVYDADIYYTDNCSSDYFTCYLYSRDYDGISFHYDYFSTNNNDALVRHADFGTITYYHLYAPIYATCWIPRKDGSDYSFLYTISVGMND